MGLFTALLVAATMVGASFVVFLGDRSPTAVDGIDSAEDLAPAAMVPVTFRNGDGGPFSETEDTYLSSGRPDTNYGTRTTLRVDGSGCATSTTTVCKSLLKFPSFIGPNEGQVPPGSTILGASLELMITNQGWTQDVYQVTESWSEATATWNGFTTPGTPTTQPRDQVIRPRPVGLFSIDITAIVQHWVNGEANEGILLASTHEDGVAYDSSESANPPSLTVQFESPGSGPNDFTIVDLGTLPGHWDSYAYAINNAGQVVGQSSGPNSSHHAFLWEDGVMTDLGTFGQSYSIAYGINDRGQVVGTAGGQAFVWEDGNVTLLGTMGNDISWATGINNAGQVVGYAYGEEPSRAFLWEDGFLTDLGTLGGAHSEAMAINDAGQVVGWSTTAEPAQHAFLWEDGVMTDLGTGEANGVNDLGQVVGTTGGYPPQPSLWENGTWSELGTAYGIPRDVNNVGQVIGEGRDDAFHQRARLWEEGVEIHLGGLGGNYDVAYGINDAGHIVGASQLPSGNIHAVLWDPPAQPPRLWSIAYLGGLEGHRASHAFAINDAGQIVGASGQRYDYASHAVLWQDGKITDLGTLGGEYSLAWGINNRGQVVGESTNASGSFRAFLWDDGVMTDLGDLGRGGSIAYDINDAGQVVGSSLNGSGRQHAFLWENGTMKDLGAFGGALSEAYGVNDRGQVVGRYVTVEGRWHAFLWENGTMTDLGSLGGGSSLAVDINNAGQIVGWSTDADHGPRTFRWEAGVMTDIGASADWDVDLARGINDLGHVAGTMEFCCAFVWQDGVLTDLGIYEFAYDINDADVVVGTSGPDAAVVWTPSASRTDPTTLSFQKGDGGAHSETNDAFIYNGAPNTNYGSDPFLYVDAADCIAARTICRTLIAYLNFIGPNAGQVPAGATILSATLELTVTNAGGTQLLYQLTESWTEAAVTWNDFDTPGMPATKGSAISFTPPVGVIKVNITAIVQNWVNGDLNFGLLISSTSTNGADYRSSESTNPPKLTVTFRSP